MSWALLPSLLGFLPWDTGHFFSHLHKYHNPLGFFFSNSDSRNNFNCRNWTLYPKRRMLIVKPFTRWLMGSSKTEGKPLALFLEAHSTQLAAAVGVQPGGAVPVSPRVLVCRRQALALPGLASFFFFSLHPPLPPMVSSVGSCNSDLSLCKVKYYLFSLQSQSWLRFWCPQTFLSH